MGMSTAGEATYTPPAAESDLIAGKWKYMGQWKRTVWWDEERHAKVDPYLRQYAPMVRGCAIRVHKRFPHVCFEDLLSDGMYALARVALKFEAERGFQFNTFAMKSVYQVVWAKAQALHRMMTSKGKEIPDELTDITAAMTPSRQRSPLDILIEEEERGLSVTWLHRHMDMLMPRDREILNLRFVDEMTLDQIAKKYGLTRERVRQVVDKALEFLTAQWRGRREAQHAKRKR
jgi:RNA polymerase sigma factor (sigma-70 family)